LISEVEQVGEHGHNDKHDQTEHRYSVQHSEEHDHECGRLSMGRLHVPKEFDIETKDWARDGVLVTFFVVLLDDVAAHNKHNQHTYDNESVEPIPWVTSPAFR